VLFSISLPRTSEVKSVFILIRVWVEVEVVWLPAFSSNNIANIHHDIFCILEMLLNGSLFKSLRGHYFNEIVFCKSLRGHYLNEILSVFSTYDT
jgi:hypothetical protein